MTSEAVKFPQQLSVPAVLKVLTSPKKIIILYGWRDGGKSTSFAHIGITKLLFEKHFRMIHLRKYYNDVFHSTFQNLKDRVKEQGVQDYVQILNGHAQLINKLRPNNFIFGAGADNPDKLRSTQDLNWVWFEEFHDAEQKDFESIIGTIREKKGFETKFIATLNNDKVPNDGFIHNTFFKEDSPIWDDVELVHVSWRDNQFIDHEANEKKLMLAVLNDRQKFDILDKGGFIPESQGEYYSEFSELNIKQNLVIDNNYPMLLSFDFNYDPTSMVFCQNLEKKGGGFNYYKEIQEHGGTMNLCHQVKKHLNLIGWSGKIEVTGDASGHKHDTKSGVLTDFKIIQSELNIPSSWVNYDNKANAALGFSRDLMNAGFYYNLINIEKNGCPLFINDIRIARPKPGSSEFVKDRNINKLDLLDAGRYAFHKHYKDVKKIQIMSDIVNKN